MADWLDNKYFRKNFCSAALSVPSYIPMATSEITASAAISGRIGFHIQPSQAKVGAVSSKIAFS